MFNFKICGIAAGAAFILSLVIGLFSGTGFLVLLLRAVIFAAVFFALSCIVFWILAQFMPELLDPPQEDDLGFPVSGSRVDISLGDGGATGAFPTDNSDMVDDIAGRPSTPARTAAAPLDQERDAGYNANGGVDGELDYADDGAATGASYNSGMAGRAGSADVLPDIDGISENTSGNAGDMVNTDEIGYNEPHRPKSSSRKSELAGDFNPKELAQAIQTVLRKDEKG